MDDSELPSPWDAKSVAGTAMGLKFLGQEATMHDLQHAYDAVEVLFG